jgi:hypothetical protein
VVVSEEVSGLAEAEEAIEEIEVVAEDAVEVAAIGVEGAAGRKRSGSRSPNLDVSSKTE